MCCANTKQSNMYHQTDTSDAEFIKLQCNRWSQSVFVLLVLLCYEVSFKETHTHTHTHTHTGARRAGKFTLRMTPPPPPQQHTQQMFVIMFRWKHFF